MVNRVAGVVIDCFFKRYGCYCSWESLTFEQKAWLEIYANKTGLTIDQVKERWAWC